MKPKITIPICPHPNKTNKDLFWILNNCVNALNDNGQEESAQILRNKILNPGKESYKALVAKMREYVDFDFA